MKVLIACEFSGTVRRAFAAAGHDAWSCDLLPSDDNSNHHIQGDARDVVLWTEGGPLRNERSAWDLLLVAHPPCTRLCNSGVRWLSVPPNGKTLEEMWADLDEGAALFSDMWNAPIERVCIENPVMHKHAKERITNYETFSQSVQPWMFGHGETKRTCLWLKGLSPLIPDFPTWEDYRTARSLPPDAVPDKRIHKMPPGANRWAERSRFFPGIAAAMAAQWGSLQPLGLAA